MKTLMKSFVFLPDQPVQVRALGKMNLKSGVFLY